MLKYVDYDIVFQEIPDEVSLAINLTNCPHKCVGCHSPQLREDIGDILDTETIMKLLEKYSSSITCICFMGGDSDIEALCKTANFVRHFTKKRIKTAWYSGNNELKSNACINYFDFIKLGEYIESFGGLDRKTTNQRLYRIENKELIDITTKMYK